MKRLLTLPAFNAACLGLFSAFYGVVFLLNTGNPGFAPDRANSSTSLFWQQWAAFLAAGWHIAIAVALVALTALVVALLLTRRRPYDEFHAARLTNCLVVSLMLTLIAIAAFYLMILGDPTGIVGKFTLFIAVNWTTVVLCDLAFVLLCRWR